MAFHTLDTLQSLLGYFPQIEREHRVARRSAVYNKPSMMHHGEDADWFLSSLQETKLFSIDRAVEDEDMTVVEFTSALGKMCRVTRRRDAWVDEMQDEIAALSGKRYYVMSARHFTCKWCTGRHVSTEAAQTVYDVGMLIRSSMMSARRQQNKKKLLSHPPGLPLSPPPLAATTVVMVVGSGQAGSSPAS
jgi:hypothetical protein